MSNPDLAAPDPRDERPPRGPMEVEEEGEELLEDVAEGGRAPGVGRDELGAVRDPEAAHTLDPEQANDDDNSAQWSRTRE